MCGDDNDFQSSKTAKVTEIDKYNCLITNSPSTTSTEIARFCSNEESNPSVKEVTISAFEVFSLVMSKTTIWASMLPWLVNDRVYKFVFLNTFYNQFSNSQEKKIWKLLSITHINLASCRVGFRATFIEIAVCKPT